MMIGLTLYNIIGLISLTISEPCRSDYTTKIYSVPGTYNLSATELSSTNKIDLLVCSKTINPSQSKTLSTHQYDVEFTEPVDNIDQNEIENINVKRKSIIPKNNKSLDSNILILYLGNESPLYHAMNNFNSLEFLAKRYQADLEFIQHRYEGDSMPSNFIKDCFKNLTVENAVRDIVTYILDKRELNPDLKIILVGASYGGMLVAYVKSILNADYIYGHVSSGPIFGLSNTYHTENSNWIHSSKELLSHRYKLIVMWIIIKHSASVKEYRHFFDFIPSTDDSGHRVNSFDIVSIFEDELLNITQRNYPFESSYGYDKKKPANPVAIFLNILDTVKVKYQKGYSTFTYDVYYKNVKYFSALLDISERVKNQRIYRNLTPIINVYMNAFSKAGADLLISKKQKNSNKIKNLNNSNIIPNKQYVKQLSSIWYDFKLNKQNITIDNSTNKQHRFKTIDSKVTSIKDSKNKTGFGSSTLFRNNRKLIAKPNNQLHFESNNTKLQPKIASKNIANIISRDVYFIQNSLLQKIPRINYLNYNTLSNKLLDMIQLRKQNTFKEKIYPIQISKPEENLNKKKNISKKNSELSQDEKKEKEYVNSSPTIIDASPKAIKQIQTLFPDNTIQNDSITCSPNISKEDLTWPVLVCNSGIFFNTTYNFSTKNSVYWTGMGFRHDLAKHTIVRECKGLYKTYPGIRENPFEDFTNVEKSFREKIFQTNYKNFFFADGDADPWAGSSANLGTIRNMLDNPLKNITNENFCIKKHQAHHVELFYGAEGVLDESHCLPELVRFLDKRLNFN